MMEDWQTRIENKLDRLTEALATLARVDEKLIAQNGRLDSHERRLNTHSSEIDSLKLASNTHAGAVKFGDKLFWMLAGGSGALLLSVGMFALGQVSK